MKRLKFLAIILLILAQALSACTPQAALPASTTTAVTTQAAASELRTLTVLAAASLTELFTELGKLFEAKNPGVTVTFSFAGSQQLAQQLGQGAAADVFASANQKTMDAAIEAKRVNPADSKPFVQNRLVVIFPKGNPAGLKELKDLSKPGLKLVLADKSVPVGQYTLDFLDKASKDPGFDTAFGAAVLKNVVSYEENVRSVLTKVVLGEADAGVVYVTDITAAAADQVGSIEIPELAQHRRHLPHRTHCGQ